MHTYIHTYIYIYTQAYGPISISHLSSAAISTNLFGFLPVSYNWHNTWNGGWAAKNPQTKSSPDRCSLFIVVFFWGGRGVPFPLYKNLSFISLDQSKPPLEAYPSELSTKGHAASGEFCASSWNHSALAKTRGPRKSKTKILGFVPRYQVP